VIQEILQELFAKAMASTVCQECIIRWLKCGSKSFDIAVVS